MSNSAHVSICVYVCVCVDIDVKEIYFKDLVHLIVEAGTSQVCKAGQQARNAVRSQGCCLEAEYLLPQGDFSFAEKAFPLIRCYRE